MCICLMAWLHMASLGMVLDSVTRNIPASASVVLTCNQYVKHEWYMPSDPIPGPGHVVFFR